MSDDLVILVPVLNRPHRVAPLLESIESSTPGRPQVLFLADGADDGEIEAIERAEDEHPGILTLLNLEGGSYAEKINRGIDVTVSSLLFFGADDLDFKPGWFGAAKAAMAHGAEVVGVNDLLRRRQGRRGHATHFLMAREYAQRPTIDAERGPLCERYTHNFVDDELIATAKARGAYAYAKDAHVEHLHWMNQKAAVDETYERGKESFEGDRAIFRERELLWA